MSFYNLLNINNIYIDDTSKSKSSALLTVSKLMYRCNHFLNEQELFNAYWEREKLGSTAIGQGILIPHICLDKITTTHACFIKLNNPVNFDADDKQPIDLIFGLVSAANNPDNHLQILSEIVTKFNNKKLVTNCRIANTIEELYHALTKESALQI